MSENARSKGMQHEAGDRAFVACQTFSDFVKDHPFVKSDNALSSLAEEIDARMGDLYQAIWKATVSEEDEKAGEP